MIKACYIRVDGDSTIGTGHIVRTEILADQLRLSGFEVTFLCKSIPVSNKIKLEKKGYNVILLNTSNSEFSNLIEVTKDIENKVLIIDGDRKEFYEKEFQIKIRKSGFKLFLITFYHNYHFYADAILNQNIMALSQTYSTEDYTVKLLGPKNVILKEEYKTLSKSINEKKFIEKPKNVLLTFGGVDSPDRTSFVYKALNKVTYPIQKIIVILGAMYQHKSKIDGLAKKSNIKTEIYQNTPKMPYLLAESHVVFNSGGLTVWESGVLQNLNIVIGHSDREQIGGKYLGDNNFGYYLGTKNDYNENKLALTIQEILDKDNSSIIKNLSKNIDANGIMNSVKTINNFKF